jgi:beta-lactamase class A
MMMLLSFSRMMKLLLGGGGLMFILIFTSCEKEKKQVPLLKVYEVDTQAFEQLKVEVEALANKGGGTIGVAVHYGENNMGFSVNGDEFFPLASVYKLPIAATLLEKVDQGKLDLDHPMVLTLDDKRHSGCFMDNDSTGKQRFEISLAELTQRMMWFSDNCATDAILRMLEGPRTVQKQLKTWAYSEGIKINRYLIEIFIDLAGQKLPADQRLWTFNRATKILSQANWTQRRIARRRFLTDLRDQGTPKAFVQLLLELQKGELLKPESTQWLCQTMAGCATGNYFLPEDLPSNYIVAHKTGRLPSIYNDAGYVDKGGDKRPMTYAVFMKDAWGKPDDERARIAEIMGKLIYFEPLKRIQ